MTKKKKKPPAPALRKEKRGELPSWLPLALVLAGAAALHATAMRAPFFADDYLFLDQVRHRGLFEALSSPDPIGNFFRPVGRQLHFWLWSHLTNESPLAFHLVSLGLFLGAVALLYELARRTAGRGAAVVAAAFLGFHYAADVPISWASGSQDLLALFFALGAVLLSALGRPLGAAAAFLLAALSKETAAGVPILCLLAAHREGEPWLRTLRRQTPVWLAFLVWAIVWLVVMGARSGGAATAAHGLSGAAAALVHAIQVALGGEWRAEDPLPVLREPWVWLVLAAGAVAAWLAAGPVRRAPRAWLLGGTMLALGAAPVVILPQLWSAYFYVLAMAGAGLLIGLAAGARRETAVAAVLVLGLASANARLTQEFAIAQTPWTRLSHVNRYYLDRAMSRVSRYLSDLKSARPTLPPRSTLFFGNFPSFLGWQAGDGPLARWAYRDSSVRSYYISSFTRARAERGPSFFFLIQNDRLVELADRTILFENLWYTQFMSGEWERARDVLEISLASSRSPDYDNYWLSWTYFALGDTARAFERLRRSGMIPSAGPSPERARIASAIAAHDSVTALRMLPSALERHVLDPELHAMTSDLMLMSSEKFSLGALEAMLTSLLRPRDPNAWRRLAIAQLGAELPYKAKSSLARYYELAGDSGRADPLAIEAERLIDRVLPGGDLMRDAVRR